MALLDDLGELRVGAGGFNPLQFIELYGGVMVDIQNYEPDPVTHRYDYYYNSRLNQLFKRHFKVNEPGTGLVIAYWDAVSEC